MRNEEGLVVRLRQVEEGFPRFMDRRIQQLPWKHYDERSFCGRLAAMHGEVTIWRYMQEPQTTDMLQHCRPKLPHVLLRRPRIHRLDWAFVPLPLRLPVVAEILPILPPKQQHELRNERKLRRLNKLPSLLHFFKQKLKSSVDFCKFNFRVPMYYLIADNKLKQ